MAEITTSNSRNLSVPAIADGMVDLYRHRYHQQSSFDAYENSGCGDVNEPPERKSARD